MATDTRATLTAANEARDRGDWSDAAELYRRLLRQAPDAYAAWVHLGHVLKEDGRGIEALVAYSRGLALRGDDPALLARLGDLHQAMGHRDQANDFYRRSAAHAGASPAHPSGAKDGAARPGQARAASPRPIRNRPALFADRKALALALAHGDAARDRRVWVLAIEHYRRYLRSRPKDFGIWVQLGHALKEAGRYGEAGEAYGEALRLRPQDADLLLNMGHLAKLRGDRQGSAAFYRQSFGQDGNPHARAELEGMGIAPAGDAPMFSAAPPASAANAAPAPVLSPTWVPILRRRRAARALAYGSDARDQRLWPLAIEHYRHYLAAWPRDFAIWVQLGHALKEAGRHGEALSAYGQAYRLDPRNADLLLSLGHLHKVMGDADSALDYYERSFALDGNAHARQEIAQISEAPGA